MSEHFDNSPAPAVERLARIEGQSNFLSLLAGVEAGPDTTGDMAALSFARAAHGCTPEALEAHVAQTSLFQLPLMAIVFKAIREYMRPKERDFPWIQGAVADAFLIVRSGMYKGPPDLGAIDKSRRNLYRDMRKRTAKSVKSRAKAFKVDEAAYSAMRKMAEGVLWNLVGSAQKAWMQARQRGEGGAKSYTVSEMGEDYRRASGHFTARPFPTAESGCIPPIETRGIGLADNLGWDDRNAAPGPIKESLETHGAAAAGCGEGDP